jgi:AcrR family transcriptional regulator
MSPSVKGSRPYDSSARQELARATRRQVLAAATELFLERGYPATTMADVAAAAGVAVQTVYSSVGGKAELLKQVVDVAIVGDDEPIPVVQRPDIIAVQAETDGRRKLEMFAAFLVTVQARTAALAAVLDVAAESDPTAAAVRDTLNAGRRDGMREFATNLREQRLLRRGVTVEKAAAILFAHMDSGVYLSLVRDSGWSARDYQRWYVTVTAAALLPDPAGPKA